MSDPTHPRLDAAELAALDKKTEAAVALLERIAREHAPAALASSLGAEDMVLTDLIARHAPSIDLFVLDTGRLHEETYALIARVEAHYGLRLRLFAPQAEDVEAFVARHGINGFYDSLEARLACCDARKVRPLARALAGKRAWITGSTLRPRSESHARYAGPSAACSQRRPMTSASAGSRAPG